MAFEIVRSRNSIKDVELVFDHLVESHIGLGDTAADAVNRAADRIRAIRADMEALARAPYQGTLSPELAAGLRHVTKNRAIFYFKPDEERQIIMVLAVFFGEHNHRRRMFRRLGSHD